MKGALRKFVITALIFVLFVQLSFQLYLNKRPSDVQSLHLLLNKSNTPRRNPISILNKVTREDVRLHPFPHIVIKNALQPSLYKALERGYPTYQEIIRTRFGKDMKISPNVRIDVPAAAVLNSKILSQEWHKFVKFHTSNTFFKEIIDVFEEAIGLYLGGFESLYGKIHEHIQTGVRGLGSTKYTDLLLDAQIGINTPVVGDPSRVRGIHIDNCQEVFAALLYFRDSSDQSEGGELELYECIQTECSEYSMSERDFLSKKLGWDVQYDETKFKKVDTIPYEPNQLVLFINGPHSFHAVTPRTKSSYPRRLVNILGEGSLATQMANKKRKQMKRMRNRNYQLSKICNIS